MLEKKNETKFHTHPTARKLNLKNTKCARDCKKKNSSLILIQPLERIIYHIFYLLIIAHALNSYPHKQKYFMFTEALSVIIRTWKEHKSQSTK